MTQIISIEGNIGSGKSTVVEQLRLNNNGKYHFVAEPVETWQSITDENGRDIVSKFYENQTKYAFSFQMMAYISRIQTLKDAIKSHPDKIIITERCVHTDKEVFARMLYDSGKIEEIEYKIYLHWFDYFIKDVDVRGIIYLKSDPDICHSRITQRSRPGEDVPLEYLKSCNDYHEKWLIKGNEKTVLCLDGNKDNTTEPTLYKSWLLQIDDWIDSDDADIIVDSLYDKWLSVWNS